MIGHPSLDRRKPIKKTQGEPWRPPRRDKRRNGDATRKSHRGWRDPPYTGNSRGDYWHGGVPITLRLSDTYGKNMDIETLDAAINEQDLIDLFDKWWSIWPTGQKQAKKDALRAWLKVFKKDPGIPTHDWKDFAENVLIQALKDQCNWRKKIFDKYPTPEDRKKHDIFVARLPMPATWLNAGRWADAVQKLPTDVAEKTHVSVHCCECPSPAAITVENEHFCAWHWTKRFNRDHLKLLADSLNQLGLKQQDGESREAWCERCRQFAIGSRWGRVIAQ